MTGSRSIRTDDRWGLGCSQPIEQGPKPSWNVRLRGRVSIWSVLTDKGVIGFPSLDVTPLWHGSTKAMSPRQANSCDRVATANPFVGGSNQAGPRPSTSNYGWDVPSFATRVSQRRVARGDRRRATARCWFSDEANILGYLRRWPMWDRSAEMTPCAAERSCRGSPFLSPVSAACAPSVEARPTARLPSLHKLTTNG